MWQKMVRLTRDWVFSWHLTERTITEMNGMAYLTTKQAYMAQMKTFEVRDSK
jgi:hypothetical protein